MSGRGPTPWALRRMTAEDVTTVHALEQRLFPADAWPPEMFSAELAQPFCWYWVAEQGSTVVGYAGLMCIPPVGDVQTIAVLPEHEGQGMGATLLNTLHGRARELGAREMLLEVRADNPRAQRLYHRFGYEHISTRPRYYRDGVDAFVLRRDLAVPAAAEASQVPAARTVPAVPAETGAGTEPEAPTEPGAGTEPEAPTEPGAGTEPGVGTEAEAPAEPGIPAESEARTGPGAPTEETR